MSEHLTSWSEIAGFCRLPLGSLRAIPCSHEREQSEERCTFKKFGRQQLRLLTALGVKASRHHHISFISQTLNAILPACQRQLRIISLPGGPSKLSFAGKLQQFQSRRGRTPSEQTHEDFVS